MINEATDKNFVNDSEKTAITHNNRSVLDNISDVGGELLYNGSTISQSLAGITWGDLIPV